MSKTLAIIALVLSIPFALIGMILGIIALVKINKSGSDEGKVIAILAIIFGFFMSIGLVLFIGPLAYFGVLSPNTMLSDRCTMSLGIECVDHQATQDSIQLNLLNGMGRDVVIDSIEFSRDATCTASGSDFAQGASHEYRATGCSLITSESGRARIDVLINWYEPDSGPDYTHHAPGEMLVTVR